MRNLIYQINPTIPTEVIVIGIIIIFLIIILKFSKKKPTKKEIINQYKKDNDLPETMNFMPGGPKMFKRDMTGLMAYFKEMTNMERIFNELTAAIRNGYTVEKYLKGANLMDDPEIREIAARGFNDVASFLKDMLEINENPELKKDYDACVEAVKILNTTTKK